MTAQLVSTYQNYPHSLHCRFTDGRHVAELPSLELSRVADGRHVPELPSLVLSYVADGRHVPELPSLVLSCVADGRHVLTCAFFTWAVF